MTARNADELQQAAAHLQTRGIEATTVLSDLRHANHVAPLVDEVLKAYGQIEILVNNSGPSQVMHAEDDPDEAWRKVMNLSVNTPFFLAREVGKRSMIPRRSGKIINIASIAGLKGSPRTCRPSRATLPRPQQ